MSDKVKVIDVYHAGRRIATIEANWISINVYKHRSDNQGLLPVAYRNLGIESDVLGVVGANKMTKSELVSACSDSIEEMFPLFGCGISYSRPKVYSEKEFYGY